MKSSRAQQDRGSQTLRAVVLDAMGVIYAARDDVEELLIPFLKSKGCESSPGEIKAKYIQCSLGQLSDRDFWEYFGIVGPAEKLNAEYLDRHTIVQGLLEFLNFAMDCGLTVHCLSNDVVEWSEYLRRKFALKEMISTWLISGDVGVRKPDEAIYRVLLETTGLRPSETLFVDDNLANVTSAQRLGFSTLHFADAGDGSAAGMRVRSYEEVRQWIMMYK